MSKGIKALAAALLLAGLVGGGTHAYFTETATNADNMFRVGTLELSLDPTSTVFDVPALAPGQQASATLGVRNPGTLPYTFTMSARKTAGYTDVYNALTCSVTSVDDSATVYSGTLAGLATSPRLVAVGATQDLKMSVGLPPDADGTLAGDYCKVSFDVAAEQQH
jgi:predicted ribosomally synthesized peptide with SipW-like signal peptide